MKEVIEQDSDAAAGQPTSSEEVISPGSRFLSKALFPSLLGLVLVAGFILRLWGISWDSYTHMHPDERFITMVTTDIRLPNSLGQYFNSSKSPLSPYNREGGGGFAYGTFPLFLTKVTGEVLQHQDFFPLNLVKDGLAKAFTGKVTSWNDYDHIYLVGRLWSVLFDTATIFFVFLTGKLLYNRRVGLLAALLLSMSVLNIQLAHFFTVDSFVTFFAAFTIYYCIRIVKFGGWGDFALAGLGFGLAGACKLSGLFLGPIVALAVIWRLWPAVVSLLHADKMPPNVDSNQPGEPPEPEDSASPEDSDVPADSPARPSLTRPILGLALAVFVAFVIFRIAEPYAFTGPNVWNIGIAKNYHKDMNDLIGLQRGGNVPFMWEWVGRTAYLFSLKNMALWGMGLPLGMAAWGGFLWAAWRLIRRRETINLLLLAWVAFFYLFWGRQFYQTMRYYLPIYPALALLAAYVLSELWGFTRGPTLQNFLQRWAARAQPAVPGLLRATVIAVPVFTVLWALAFTNVYRQPLSRIEASSWMIDNLPAKSVITHEVWDDTVPFGLPKKASDFKILDIEPYGADLSDPSSQLLSKINQADYLVLSSNRLYASIPRAPAKWPMTSNFYTLLLADKLPGFRLVKTFTSYPTIFGISINDDSAEGNFTVYDHPKVLLYEKTADYSPETFMAGVGASVCSTQVPKPELVPSNAAQNALLMRPGDCQTQRAGGTWTSIFDVGSMSNRFPVVTWLLVIEIMSLAFLPLGLFIFRSLPDRGYLLCKPLGILAVSWLVWLGASVKVFHYNRDSIFAMLVLLIIVGAVVARFTRESMLTYVRDHWRRILISEAIFLGAFLIFYWIRTLDPDLWHPYRGGEKPMEFAYLNAITRSTTMPPYDPWFAGGYMNYYYFGHFIVATLIKFTGILPEVAFNLAVPMFFALTVGAAFSVVYNLTEATRLRVRWRPGFKRIGGSGPMIAGLLGVVLVAVIGNLHGLYQTADHFSKVSSLHAGKGIYFVSGFVGMIGGIWKAIFGGGVHLLPFNFWDPSRMMPPQASITEFPFFTFLFADLHAHLMAIPFDVAIIGTALALVLSNRKDEPSARGRQLRSWLGLGVLGLLIGALRPINSWDYPPFLLFGIAAVFIAERAEEGCLNWPLFRRGLVKAVALVVLSVAFFLPFWQSYHLAYKGFHASLQTTPFHQYLAHFGILLFCIATIIVAFGGRFFRRRPAIKVMLYLGTLAGMLALILAGMALSGSKSLPITFKGLSASKFLGDLFSNHIPVVALALVVIALLAILIWRELRGQRPDAPLRLFVLTMIGLALTLSAMVDIITLDGDIDRMNTVFKFYLHIWLLLALSGAFGIWYVFAVMGWRPLKSSPVSGFWQRIDLPKAGWLVALVILIGAGLIYPISGTRSRVSTADRFAQYTGHGNNGMEYMLYAVYNEEFGKIDLSFDYDAIQWMRANVEGSPVIVEGQAPGYRWGARFSIYTGLPTVIGWDWHQQQQRAEFATMVTDRGKEVKAFYSGTSVAAADTFLSKYQVQYVIVGQLERLYYPKQGLDKFAAMSGRELDLVFENEQVKIYQVVSLPPLMPNSVRAQ